MTVKGSTLFQYSTISALIGTDLYGSITFEELLSHGNFGLGTFHAVDGELIVLDNKAYQMLATGEVNKVTKDMTSPFVTLTKFKVDQTLNFNNISYQEFKQQLVKSFPSLNLFYAIKVSGTFNSINTRTVSKQQEPFPSLKEAVNDQKQVSFNEITGNLVMFWTPNFANTIGVQGFHAHFISNDKKHGGHVFNFSGKDIKVEICYLTNLNLQLPTSQSYLRHQVDDNSLQADIKTAES